MVRMTRSSLSIESTYARLPVQEGACTTVPGRRRGVQLLPKQSQARQTAAQWWTG